MAATNAYPLKIVTCREDVDVDALVAEFHITLQNPKHHLRNLKMFFATLDDAAIKKLKADPRVVAVEADGPVSLCADGIGEGYNAFGIVRMGIPAFPPARYNGITEPIDVDVAVLDSGIGPHADLNIVDNYSTYDEDGLDTLGHGTSVAGIVGALDNGIGSVGVAPGVRIWNVKSIGPPPFNNWTVFLNGMDYVRQHANKISVANISIVNTTTTAPYSALRGAVRSLVRSGIVVVAAAGNGPGDGVSPGWDMAGPDGVYGTGDDAIPASTPYSMAVSAMDSTQYPGEEHPWDKLWPGSNFSQVPRPAPDPLPPPTIEPVYPVSPGGAIDVAAPGVEIYTTAGGPGSVPNGYSPQTGTSFAAPHVAGLVALYIAANGRATNEYGVYKIRQAIIDASQPQSQWATAGATDDPDTNREPLAIASENWIPKPVITNTAGAPGNFSVRFATVPGYNYTVQSSTNLAAPTVWTNLATVTGGSNVAPASVTDTNAASQSFYRLERNPSGGVPQVITTQPASGWAKLPGTTLSLSVSVAGTPPFSYLWQKDGSSLADGGNISGAATVSLVLTNVQLADAGACHGPLKAHNEWQRRSGQAGRKDPTLAKASRAQVLDNCGFCHARRSDLTGDFKPGDRFSDHFDLTVVDDSERYYADGQVRDEDYEYGSFLGSRMHQRGVICTDCHDPHSAKTILPGNTLCLRCHNGSDTNAPAINPVTHSRHKVFGHDAKGLLVNNDLTSYKPSEIAETGGECVNCHMPQTTYMQRHRRHDHGFTIPDPLLTKKFNIPNACNRCHQDKSVDWALAYSDQWYGAKMNRSTRTRAEWIARAQQNDPAARAGLLDLLAREESAYWRAALLGLLAPWAAEPEITAVLKRSLEHTNDLVRGAAAHALEPALSVPGVTEALRRRLGDPSLSVRLASAWPLRASLDPDSPAGQELRHFLDSNADQPSGQMRKGDYFLARNEPQTALGHYEKAVSWDPYSAPFRQQAAVALSVLNRPREAVEALREACRLSPKDAEARYQLGLACNEAGDLNQARQELETAVQLNPRHAAAWYNLGLAQNASKQPELAIESLRRGESVEPRDPRIPYARATIHARLGQTQKAVLAARRALEINPAYAEARQLLQQLGE